MEVEFIKNSLLRGDPLEPSSLDLIVQEGSLKVGLPVPDGWRVLSGNMRESSVARVVMRFEIDGAL